jgi:hypothetical protein
MVRHRGVARHVRSKGTLADHMGVRVALCCILNRRRCMKSDLNQTYHDMTRWFNLAEELTVRHCVIVSQYCYHLRCFPRLSVLAIYLPLFFLVR